MSGISLLYIIVIGGLAWALWKRPVYRKTKWVPFYKYQEKYRTQYLKSNIWNMRRRNFYVRNKRECAVCGYKKGAELHHITYARKGNEADQDLIVLCRMHHDDFHASGLPISKSRSWAAGKKLEWDSQMGA